MAKTKRQQQQKQQQLLVIYLTTCLVAVLLLMKVDSVSAANVPLDGNGNILLQQPRRQHVIDNTVPEHNFITDPTMPLISENEDPEVKKVHVDLLRNQIDFGQQFKPFAVVKRTPGGFVGMRGKKLFEENDNNSEDTSENDLNFNLPWNQLQDSDEVIDWNDYAEPNVRRYKKTPNAFYGVRGKKFVNMNAVNLNSDKNRLPNFLQKIEEERIRDAILQDFVERLVGTKSDVTNDMAKRAPTGFTGVRGKRPSLNELAAPMDSLSKRGLGNNAFIGVRGKKDVSHQTVKRSPSFPGRNGKRQRFVDLNNKFVAVRGKKSSYNGMSALNAINHNEAPLDTVSLSSFDKRTPKGFLGMRGKRPFTTDDV